MVMLICQIAKKKRYFFNEYGDAYMPNSEKKNAIFLVNMVMLICQIAK